MAKGGRPDIRKPWWTPLSLEPHSKGVRNVLALRFLLPKMGMRLGITTCAIRPAATYAAATDRFHSPAGLDTLLNDLGREGF
jgi:hypothetical protein